MKASASGVEVKKVENQVAISVQDNGLGINLEKHRKDMFQIHKRFHDHVHGRGIGLYSVRRKVESLGGSIDVESEPYQGSRFIILLPFLDGKS